MTACYVQHEAAIQQFENGSDVVEWDSPDIGSHTQGPHWSAVVSSAQLFYVTGVNNQILMYLHLHAIVVNAMQPSWKSSKIMVRIYSNAAEEILGGESNPQKTHR